MKKSKSIKGITERKDGRYAVKYTSKSGKVYQTTKKELKEARQWLSDIEYNDNHNLSLNDEKLTVKKAYERWLFDSTHRGGSSIKINTQLNYEGNWKRYIEPFIGSMKIVDVKPTHCREILDNMHKDGYAISTQVQCYETLGTFFKWCKENDIIRKHPLDTIQKPKEVILYSEDDEEDDEAEVTKCNFLSLEEEKKFLMVAKDYNNYEEFFLMLNTGMRLGEVIALRWSCVDMKNKTIKIKRTGMYRDKLKGWIWSTPKTKSSLREIKMSEEVYRLFEIMKKEPRHITDKTEAEMKDLVFLNRNGVPTRHANYSQQIKKICELAEIKHIRCHDLRHTFATRFCEQSKDYYFLARYLGHKNIDITIKTYVHETEEEKQKEIDNLSKYFTENGIKLM